MEDKRIQDTVTSLAETLNKEAEKHNLSPADIVRAYGFLGYSIGACMGKYEVKGPGDIEELQKQYYANPTVELALMLQGLLITTWPAEQQTGETEVSKK